MWPPVRFYRFFRRLVGVLPIALISTNLPLIQPLLHQSAKQPLVILLGLLFLRVLLLLLPTVTWHNVVFVAVLVLCISHTFACLCFKSYVDTAILCHFSFHYIFHVVHPFIHVCMVHMYVHMHVCISVPLWPTFPLPQPNHLPKCLARMDSKIVFHTQTRIYSSACVCWPMVSANCVSAYFVSYLIFYTHFSHSVFGEIDVILLISQLWRFLLLFCSAVCNFYTLLSVRHLLCVLLYAYFFGVQTFSCYALLHWQMHDYGGRDVVRVMVCSRLNGRSAFFGTDEEGLLFVCN